MKTCASLALAALVALPRLSGAQEVVLRHFTVAEGLADTSVTRLFEDSRGFIWIATAEGVSRFDGHVLVTYRQSDGLPASPVTSITEDGGALWFATRGGRAVRVNDKVGGAPFIPGQAPPPFTRMSRTGTRRYVPARVLASRQKDLAASILRDTTAAVSDVLEDRNGTLWIGTTGAGVFAIPAERVVTYTAAHELPDAHVVRVLESRDGRIYAVTRRGGVAELREDGVDAVAGSIFAPFHTMGRRIAQDEQGTWWFGTDAGVFSAPGPALSFASARRVTDSAPPLLRDVERTFTDSRGWTWEALTAGGVARCNDRGCIDYSRADGIGHEVTSMAEDPFGRVYFGTAKGLIRFDPHTRLFSALESGFRAAAVTHCLRDTRGRMWIATTRGVSYLRPSPPQSRPAAPVYFTVAVTGATHIALPPRGAADLTLESGTSETLRFDYAAPAFANGAIRYQHRLAPLQREWSEPRAERTRIYPALAPGLYTFTVRAIGADGTTGPPATVRIRIRRSWWTWWWTAPGGLLFLFGARSLRQRQRAHRRRDLAGVPLRMLGRVEDEAEDGRRHRRPSDGARIFER